jgi:hypothetical protein
MKTLKRFPITKSRLSGISIFQKSLSKAVLSSQLRQVHRSQL